MLTLVAAVTLLSSSLFFESVTWDETTVGFEHVPGGLDYANRSVLSWHFYSPPLVSLLSVWLLKNHNPKSVMQAKYQFQYL